MRRWIAWSSLTFVLASGTAHAVTANPTVQISNDGPIDSFTNLPQLVELYDVGCSENGTGVTYVWQGIDLFRASDGTQIGGEGGLGNGDGSGPPNGTALASPLAGVKVVARFEDVSCSNGTESAPAQTVSSNEIIIPPTMTMSSVVGSNDDGTISVGQAVRFNPIVGCNLAPSETITFSITGPGISFTKAYADWTDFRADPDAMVPPTPLDRSRSRRRSCPTACLRPSSRTRSSRRARAVEQAARAQRAQAVGPAARAAARARAAPRRVAAPTSPGTPRAWVRSSLRCSHCVALVADVFESSAHGASERLRLNPIRGLALRTCTNVQCASSRWP